MSSFDRAEAAEASSFSFEVREAAPLEELVAEPEGRPADQWDWARLHRVVWPALVEQGVRHFGFAKEDCEDALQLVYTRILVKRPRVREPEAYLRRAFLNACCDLTAERSRRRSRERAIDDAVAADDGVARRLLALCAVADAYRQIDPRCREVITSYCLEERTLRETARLTGYSEKTIWKRVSGCMKRLRVCLEA